MPFYLMITLLTFFLYNNFTEKRQHFLHNFPYCIQVEQKADKKFRQKEGKMKKAEECYTNRELSQLQFNERVLNEAGNQKVPLAERLTFAFIYQTNLDEFFMVRVGTLMVQMNSKEKIRDNKTNMTSKEQVQKILERVHTLEEKKARIYEQLMGELEPKGIRIIN